MKASILSIRLGGIINLLVGVLHITFWNLFDWQVELAKLSVENSNVVQMLNLFTIVFFFYSAAMLVWAPAKLLESTVGRLFIGMMATLYVARLAMEFYFPEGSLGFAAFLLITALVFAVPLATSNPVRYAHS